MVHASLGRFTLRPARVIVSSAGEAEERVGQAETELAGEDHADGVETTAEPGENRATDEEDAAPPVENSSRSEESDLESQEKESRTDNGAAE